jgi:hypothetical protein
MSNLLTSLSLSAILSGALPDLARDALQATADKWFHWLLVSSAVVALGVALEAWEATIILKRWYRLKRDKEVTAPNEKSWAIPASYLGLLLVIAGVVGEGVFDALVSNADTALRAHDSQILAQTHREASDANDRATAAQTRADAAESHAAEVQESVAPRRLTGKQPLLIATRLSRFSRQPMVAIHNTFDVEASVLAAEILATLESAKWVVHPTFGVNRPVSWWERAPSVPQTGIFIEASLDKRSQSAARALSRELSDNGFDCRVRKNGLIGSSLPFPLVLIDVEARPEGPQGEAKLRAEAMKSRASSTQPANR